MLLASFPSPSSEAIVLGPLTLRAYGLAIAFGVIAAVWLAQKRWAAVGGDPDDISKIAMWAVPAGLIGSRIYHVLTDWRFDEGWAEPFKIWKGGLGIPGGMAAGIIVGLWVIHRNGWDRGRLLDAIIPGLPLAQAVGRIGNWFNQELYGGPTDLPWAVEIDPEHRPVEHLTDETFHPTFLYEAVWNLGLVLFLIWVGKTKRLKSGGLLAVYVVGYLVARFWLETVRIDPATEVGGVRVNIWMSIVGIVVAGAWLIFRGGVGSVDPADERDRDEADGSSGQVDGSDDAGAGVEPVEVAVPDDGTA